MNSTIDFFSIDYLQHGTPEQQEVFSLLKDSHILELLSAYSPVLAGTIPIAVDVPGSDLDILCSFTDSVVFKQTVTALFSDEANFSVSESEIYGHACVVANFNKGGYPIEIFAQAIPVREQMGYRHMVIEHWLLQQHGDPLRQEVIRLKKEGYKTEPAFCMLLGIEGDPYLELLKLDAIACP